MGRLFTAAIAGALAIFICNAVSWMVLPFHGEMLNTLPESVVTALESEPLPFGSGIYHYPGFEVMNSSENAVAAPRIPFMMVVNESTLLFDPRTFAKSFLFNLVSAALLLLLMRQTSIQSYSKVATLSLSAGLLVSFMSDFPQTSWFMLPLSYALTNAADHVVSMLVAGSVMWFIVRGKFDEKMDAGAPE